MKLSHLQGHGWTQRLSHREKSEKNNNQLPFTNAYMWNLENDTDEPICKVEIEMQT